MRNRPLLILSLVLTLIATTAFAAKEPRNEPVGKMTASATIVDWAVAGDHAELQLNVKSPDGDVKSFRFAAGQKASLRVSDLGKSQDGTYAYELLYIPRISAETSSKLKAARASGDEKAAAKAQKEAGLDKRLVQSGSFSMSGGAFVSSEAEEGQSNSGKSQDTNGSSNESGSGSVGVTARKPWQQVVQDQVIPDDLIVQGSICAGFDCVNNESFGFDTIRMKENNTRVKFEDTSVGSFPTNDWQLTANDSASGGSSKFSIEDITGSRVPFTITAGAATNSIFLDSSGRLGYHTSTPVLDLHINSATANTPAIRLEQSSSGGFTAQTWDIAGNEANFFVRDVTGGSLLPFRIRPGAPTSSVDISSDGDVGIGTASPDAKLDVENNVALSAVARFTNNSATGFSGFEFFDGGTQALFLGSDNAANNIRFNATNSYPLVFLNSGTEAMRLTSAGLLGIGTAAPSSKLHVNGGDIRVSGGSFIDDGVTLNVPDYVFDESYKLMSVKDLAEYVKTEKHLPNVPNREDVKSSGLNLSQMQMRLLEKVEELTLYTINQHEQITELKQQLETLKKQLDEKN